MIDLTLRSDPFLPTPIQPPQGKFKSIALIRATDENAAPQNGGVGESPTRVGPQPGPRLEYMNTFLHPSHFSPLTKTSLRFTRQVVRNPPRSV